MKPLMVAVLVLGSWAATDLPAPAAWNNVFQPTLFGRCRPKPATSNYTPVVVQSAPVMPACNTCQSAPPPAPCNNCTTSYTQRCFYQPVTTYETKTYYEPVTTTQTSYYYEPVTSYRMSCYVDPCTGCSKQVAIPTTSYQLRAQSCPVQSWVQRCVQVPVTAYQKSCYWQPQTTCCQTTVGALIPATGAEPPVVVPHSQLNPPANQPTNPPPSIKEDRQPGGDFKYYPPQSSWQPTPDARAPQNPVVPTTNPPPPAVKLENIVVTPDATVEGQVVRSDNTPRPNAKLLFVGVGSADARQEVTTNTAGRFQLTLASGSYHVYTQTADGTTHYHSRIDVNGSNRAPITLVNR